MVKGFLLKNFSIFLGTKGILVEPPTRIISFKLDIFSSASFSVCANNVIDSSTRLFINSSNMWRVIES